MPNRQSPAFHSHGDTEVKVLADHFFDGDDSEAEEFKTEWKKLKYDLLSWKEHIPKDTADGKKSTPTEWSLKRVMAMKSTFGQFYPKFVQVAEAALAIPVSNAWPERGASQLKLIKTRIRSQIKNDLLASLLHVAINGPVPHTEACDSLVSKAVDMWKAAKKRRKLPHHRPSTQPQANSETEVATPITVVQDMGTQTDVTSTYSFPHHLLLLYTTLLLLRFLMKTLLSWRNHLQMEGKSLVIIISTLCCWRIKQFQSLLAATFEESFRFSKHSFFIKSLR